MSLTPQLHVGGSHLEVVAEVGNHIGCALESQPRQERQRSEILPLPTAQQQRDAYRVRRRLQALVAIGWSQAKLADRLGMLGGNFGRVIGRTDQVLASTARAAQELYEELWSSPPPETDHRSRQSASRARNQAARAGWAPPLAWDDDTIDDPTAMPDLGQVARAGLDLDEVAFLEEGGASIHEISRRLGVSVGYIETVRRRAAVREAMPA
jgi:hypothetical protein